MAERRVVVTGLGTVNGLANSVPETWEKIKNGENGVGPITHFDPEGFSSKVAAEVKNFDPTNWIEKKEARRMDAFIHYATVASIYAMEDSGLTNGGMDPERTSVIFGNGIGGIQTFEEQKDRFNEKGAAGVHPLFIPKMIINEAAGMVAIRYNAQGPCFSIVTACSSGSDAIGYSLDLIRRNVVDVVVTGGTEAPITHLGVSGFCSLQAVSTNFNDTPEKASRPFDKDRDGFVIAEGSGIIVIEELDHALKRGAQIYCELAGYGATCDAYHITAPRPDGSGGVRAMKLAVQDAGLQLEDIDYINAHGTSTPLNDPTETKAIKSLFADQAYKLKVSSTKSMHGHMLGGAGGMEAVVCALALKDQVFPPTRNLDNPDPECDLDYVPHKSQKGEIRAALSNSLGFGGHNGVLCFKKYDQ